MTKIMSIISDQATIPEACIAWLAANAHLSPASRMSYQGEIDRFGQYVAAKFGLLNVAQLCPLHWEKYLRAMGRSRKPVRTRRSDVLKASSVLQAMRISRQFLIWCAEQGALKWWPPRLVLPTQSEEREAGSRGGEIPKELRLALGGAAETIVTPQDARALLAINLAYWGALDVGELAALKVLNLEVLGHPRLLLFESGREVQLPAHLRRLWQDYRDMRQDTRGQELAQGAPLLAALEREAPLRPWSIWALVKNWQEQRGIEPALSPQMLRSAFMKSAQTRECGGMAASIAHAGMVLGRVAAAPGDISVEMRRIQRDQLCRLAG